MASQTPQSIGFGHLCALGDLAEVFARIGDRLGLASTDVGHASLDIGTAIEVQKSAIIQVQSPNQSRRHRAVGSPPVRSPDNSLKVVVPAAVQFLNSLEQSQITKGRMSGRLSADIR